MTKDLRNKLLAQALLVLSQVAFPLVTYPIITKVLGANGLGKVNFADSIVQAVMIAASLGIPLYGIREIAINKSKLQLKSKVFLELFTLQALIIIPALAFIWIIGLISHVDYILLWTGSIALIGSLLSSEWFFQGNENFLFVAVRSFLIRVAGVILIFILVREAEDYSIYYMILAGTVVLTMALNFIMISSKISISFQQLNPWRHLKKINWIYACYVLASLYAVLDSLMLGWISTEEAVGRYSFGYRLVRMSSMLIPTLGVVFIPGIAFHHATENKNEIQRHIKSSQQIIFFFAIPLSISLLVLAPEIVAVFASPEFLPTINVLRILSPLPLLIAFSHLTGTQILVSIKKEKLFFIFLLVGSVLNVLVDLILIPILQEKGAAISNLMTEGFIAIGTLLYLLKYRLLFPATRQFLYCLLSSFLLIPIVYCLRLLELSSLIVLFLSLLFFGIIYLIIHLTIIRDTFIRKLFSFRRIS